MKSCDRHHNQYLDIIQFLRSTVVSFTSNFIKGFENNISWFELAKGPALRLRNINSRDVITQVCGCLTVNE